MQSKFDTIELRVGIGHNIEKWRIHRNKDKST